MMAAPRSAHADRKRRNTKAPGSTGLEMTVEAEWDALCSEAKLQRFPIEVWVTFVNGGVVIRAERDDVLDRV